VRFKEFVIVKISTGFKESRPGLGSRNPGARQFCPEPEPLTAFVSEPEPLKIYKLQHQLRKRKTAKTKERPMYLKPGILTSNVSVC